MGKIIPKYWIQVKQVCFFVAPNSKILIQGKTDRFIGIKGWTFSELHYIKKKKHQI